MPAICYIQCFSRDLLKIEVGNIRNKLPLCLYGVSSINSGRTVPFALASTGNNPPASCPIAANNMAQRYPAFGTRRAWRIAPPEMLSNTCNQLCASRLNSQHPLNPVPKTSPTYNFASNNTNTPSRLSASSRPHAWIRSTAGWGWATNSLNSVPAKATTLSFARSLVSLSSSPTAATTTSTTAITGDIGPRSPSGSGSEPRSQNPAASRADSGGSGTGGGGSSTVTPARRLQPVDYSTLVACCEELQAAWVPAKVEQVVMPDKTSLCVRLRTPSGQGWLRICWHPTAGRLTVMRPGEAPERGQAAELYSLGEQVRDALCGRVLLAVSLPAPWERVADLAFGVRPGEPPSHHMYCEVMARYSNVILTDASGVVLAAAYQVGGMMSSHRTVQVGRTYALPPVLYGVPPTAVTSLGSWRDTLTRAAELAARTAAATASQRRSGKQAGTDAASNGAASGEGGNTGGGAAAAAIPETTSAANEGTAATTTSAAASVPTSAAPSGPSRLLDGFLRAFHGVSPALVEELCGAAGVAAEGPPGGLTEAEWGALFDAWMSWQQRLASGAFTATSDPDTGRYSVLGGSLPRRHPSVNDLLEEYYGGLAAAEAHGQLAGRLAGVVAAALKKARGKVRAFTQQLSDSERAEAVRRQADLITANIYRIPPGAPSVTVEDWDTGQKLTLQLDPTQPPAAAAEALYKKARKLRRAVDAVQPLLAATQEEVSYLEEVEVVVAGLARWSGDVADMEALREVQDELIAGKYMKPPPDAALAVKTAARAAKAAARAASKMGASSGGGGGGKKGKGGGAAAGGGVGPAVEDTSSARRFTSPGGYTVLVGRNNKQNDVLSTQVAGPDDLWLHVRGMPGSHTLLRVPSGRPAPGEADIQFAANLAAFYSRARDCLKADVILTRGAWVRKPRGAKPGAVAVTKELRNVVARPGDSAAAGVEAMEAEGGMKGGGGGGRGR